MKFYRLEYKPELPDYPLEAAREVITRPRSGNRYHLFPAEVGGACYVDFVRETDAGLAWTGFCPDIPLEIAKHIAVSEMACRHLRRDEEE